MCALTHIQYTVFQNQMAEHVLISTQAKCCLTHLLKLGPKYQRHTVEQ